MDGKDKEDSEESDNENLRELILQQLSNLEQSDVSDEDSYQVRLSCILEDDESESSGAAQREFAKDVEKGSERTKESEKGPPEDLENIFGVQLSESMYDSEMSDDFAGENVQITDLDDVTLCETLKEKTDDGDMEKTEENASEETSDEYGAKGDGFAIKKLKSSDNVHKRPFIVKRRELSSDSSDLDISVEGGSSDLKIVEMTSETPDDENTLNLTQDNVYAESETSADEEPEQKIRKHETDDYERSRDIEQRRRKEEELEEKKRKEEELEMKRRNDEELEMKRRNEEELEQKKRKEEELEQKRRKEEELDQKRRKEEELDQKRKTDEGAEQKTVKDEVADYERSGDLEVVDNETLASIFAKVSRTYLEKTKSNVKWEENEKIEKVFKEAIEEKVRTKMKELQPGEHLSLQDAHIRGTSPKEYNPPVPPETYLWEELKRLRERGGYPWTYLDKPPFDEATWKKYMEHVYEPINPSPLTTEKKQEPTRVEVTEKAPASTGSSIPETETKQFVRVPSENEFLKKGKDSGEDSKNSEDMEVERISDAQELQDRLENRFLGEAPTPTTETTASQSRTDVTSSILDTSGLEDFPVKPVTLGKTRREQMRVHAQEIQQRLRNHAGRIRTKFNNMPRPSMGRRDRIQKEKSGDKLRFRIPEMHAPKINLPDRSKFKLPEKAKFHLPESAKFHLPESAKFHLPESAKIHLPSTSKFRLPEKEKFHLPERPKLSLSERAKLHFPDKGKFHLPEKAKFHLPERAKFHLPEKAKFHLPEKAKFNLPNRPKLDLNFGRSPRDAQSSSQSPKKGFDFDFKSYPKLFTKHSKEYTTSSPKQTRGHTPPPRMKQEDVPAQKSPEKWAQKLEDLQYADDDLEENEAREKDSRKSDKFDFDFTEKEEGYMEDFAKMPTISTKSSASRLSDKEMQSSESSEERKKGVLEEINPDEFFLRQKGISQDDIDMGKYLSHEIREAFRSPDVNALAKMDYIEGDQNVDPRQYRIEPKRPKRTGSIKKKSILKKTSTSDPSISDDGYKTYPPRRPGRKSRSQSKSLLNEEAIIAEPDRYEIDEVNISRYDNLDVNLSRYDNEDYDEDNISEYYKSPGPAKEYQHYKIPRSHMPISPSPPVKRKSSVEDDSSHKRILESWYDGEEFQMSEPPKPTARRKQNKKKKMEELESTGEEQMSQEISKEPEEVVPEPPVVESPVPPKRTRTRSSGSRSFKSFTTEDEGSRSFQSEPGKDRAELQDEIIFEQRQQVEESPLVKSSSEFMKARDHEYEMEDLDDAGFGYATVGKPTVSKPERQKKQKPERPPPPRRKKEISVPTYNTYPRRTPVRPLRNYSTLGPSRPPRKRRVPPIEQALAERQLRTHAEIKSQQFDEPLDVIEVSGSSKDLQTEKVIEKMKGRPLPPPPRPPRQKSRGEEDDMEPTEEEKLSLSILRDEEFPIERKVAAFVHQPPPSENETVDEICASTQTDPLPEDFSFGTEESSDMIQEFSHEQLRIQEAFLEEMKKEEEEIRQRGRTNENDMVDAELKAEVIRQIEDIIAEEKRMMEERKEGDRRRREESGKSQEPKTGRSYLDVDADMGYASLDRRGHRQEPQTPSSPDTRDMPTKMEKLQVKELEVEALNVHEVQADQIFVRELQGNRIASQDIDNTGGNLVLGNVELPSSFIQQIVAKIPWDTLRREQERNAPQTPSEPPTSFPQSPPARPQRRQRGPQLKDDSDDETVFQPRKTHRRHHRHQYSSDEEDRREIRQLRSAEPTRDIPELSLQLVRACTSAGAQALRNFVQANASIAQSLDREMCVQAIISIAVALIAGFFLFGFDAKIVHLHRWDFQFPPQPPPHAGF